MAGIDENVTVDACTVTTQAFPLRPSALVDIRDFTRRLLTYAQTVPTDGQLRALWNQAATLLLEGAGRGGSIEVAVRLFPDRTEIDILRVAARPDESVLPLGASVLRCDTSVLRPDAHVDRSHDAGTAT